MNISRKPLRNHGPQLARSANATVPGIRVLSRPRREVLPSRPRQDSSPSPSLESTSRGQPDRQDRRDHEEQERIAE